VHKGHLLDAAISSELLVSLFIPEGINKLHDGAVIIRNYRIAKAGVFFPMPDTRVVDESFGSRHRAALGITEETDAVVVVVSEERGTISFCFNGNIASNLDGPKLRTMLEAIFSPKIRKKKKGPMRPSVPPDAEAAQPSERITKILPPSEKTPKPLKPVEAEPPAPLRERDSEPPPPRDSEPPPPLRPRAAPEPESPGSGPAPRVSVPPTPLRTPVEMPRARTDASRASHPDDVAIDDEKKDRDSGRESS
jgi:hypothetical protein